MKSQTFGEKIKAKRNELNLSLRFVGEQITYSRSSLSKIEKNQLVAPEKIIRPLARVLEFTYKDLMVKYLSERIFYEVKNLDFANEAIQIVANRLRNEGKGTYKVVSKENILAEIKKYFYSKPVEKAWIFGSFARSTNVSFDSDIDILVKFKKPNSITLFDLIEMKNDLRDKTGRKIDLVEEGQELKPLKKSIQQEKVLVYAN